MTTEIFLSMLTINHLTIITLFIVMVVITVEVFRRNTVKDILYEGTGPDCKLSIGRTFLLVTFTISIFYWIKQLIVSSEIPFPMSLENIIMFLLIYVLGSKGINTWRVYKTPMDYRSSETNKIEHTTTICDNSHIHGGGKCGEYVDPLDGDNSSKKEGDES